MIRRPAPVASQRAWSQQGQAREGGRMAGVWLRDATYIDISYLNIYRVYPGYLYPTIYDTVPSTFLVPGMILALNTSRYRCGKTVGGMF